MTDSRTVQAEPTIRVMYSAEQIATRVRELGLEIARDLGPLTDRPLFVGVLKGASMFQCDLARATPLDVELDYLSVSSYGKSMTSSGFVKIIYDLRGSVENRHVVLCEGVVDSGLTLTKLMELLRHRGAASLRIATLLDKVPCRKMPVTVDYVGWTIESEFVIGYGMDYAERYRNLPYVGILEES